LSHTCPTTAGEAVDLRASHGCAGARACNWYCTPAESVILAVTRVAGNCEVRPKKNELWPRWAPLPGQTPVPANARRVAWCLSPLSLSLGRVGEASWWLLRLSGRRRDAR
jgi:hypothetical protein